ncbi:glycosyltransferase [Sphingomonas sp. AR_OL41]|uniref:glycosyltransferase n=1 Tax=Sphingomonas sp. AR_OL41 TaxID=3042729 RepID=UPI002480FF44|nr:glycosyltransferase [Sphingomonas sp. AR_OL41]MDH7974643.1 glycosyltransferase [Sphingomonas sp. AR_OL41]
MRIVQLVRDVHPRAGGPPRVVIGSSIALAALGHEVSIAAIGTADDARTVHAAWPELRRGGVTLRLFVPSRPAFLGASAALARAMRADGGDYDLMHMHGVWDGCLIAAARAARGARRPYFISPHGMLDRWSMARSAAKKKALLVLGGGNRFLAGAAGMIFGTADEAEEADRIAPDVARITVPNGVDARMVAPRDASAADRLHAAIPATRNWSRTILFYSRLHPKKNVDGLIAAFARVADAFPGTGLLIAGIADDAAYEAQIRAAAAAPALAGRIVVTTALTGPDSRFVLDAVDVFALPSHQEGFSIAIIEAMARGIPVLISDRCHMPEVAETGAGEVVPPTPDGLVAGLTALLSRDGDALRAAGACGARLVADHFTWPSVATRLEAIYAAALRP